MKPLGPRLTATLLRPALVPFLATKLANADVIYQNDGCRKSTADVLQEWAYQVPRVSDQPARFLERKKKFHAERYGGSGLLSNGGGARCGLSKNIQIKGIGPNPLVGEGTDYWYANGAMSLADALKEAVWGEVLPLALPFGGVPVLAVIATGTKCRTMGPRGTRVSVPRGLVVRQNAIRAGHFERATYFRPQAAFKSMLPSDTERVRAMIKSLPNALSCYATPTELAAFSDPIERTHELLARFASRVAIQLATSKAKRIMHGGLSSSNISVDGRWLDYGSISSLPGFANTGNYDPSFWLEHTIVGEMFRSLAFFCGKYLITGSPRFSGFDDIDAHFDRHYVKHLHHQFALLAGYPEMAVSGDASRTSMLQLGEILVQLAKAGTEKPFRGATCALRHYGAFRLGEILEASAQSGSRSDRERRIAPHIADVRLRGTFIARASAVAESAEAEGNSQGVSTIAVRQLATLNAAKSAAVLPEIFEPTLASDLARLVAESGDARMLSDKFRQLVGQVTDSARVAFERATSWQALCFKRGANQVTYDAAADVWHAKGPNGCATFQEFPKSLHECLTHCAPAFTDVRRQ